MGLLSNEDTVSSPNNIQLYGPLSIQDNQLGPSGLLYGEVSLYMRTIDFLPTQFQSS